MLILKSTFFLMILEVFSTRESIWAKRSLKSLKLLDWIFGSSREGLLEEEDFRGGKRGWWFLEAFWEAF